MTTALVSANTDLNTRIADFVKAADEVVAAHWTQAGYTHSKAPTHRADYISDKWVRVVTIEDRGGKPVLYYTWTPYWVSNELKPGKDVVWLEVPFSSLPGEQKGLDTRLPNGKNYGFVVNQQQIVANKAWAEANPAAAKLFEVMQLPVADINAQNHLMSRGQNKAADIERHVNGWIKAHQKTFDCWVQQALAAAR